MVITEEENCFAGWQMDVFSSSIYKSDFLNATMQLSVFNEIFLICNLSGNKKVIPLKRALFLNRVFLICSYYSAKAIKKETTTIPFALFLFKLLKHLGYTTIKAFRDHEAASYIIYELCLIKITESNVGFRVIEYNDQIDGLNPINLENDVISKINFDLNDCSEYFGENFTNLQAFIADPLTN